MNHKKKCHHCKCFYKASSTNYYKEEYCSKEECRKASSRASSRKNRKKAENNTEEKRKYESNRVKAWQRKNPDYWRNRNKKEKKTKKIENNNLLRDFNQGGKDDLNNVLRDLAFSDLQSQISKQEYVLTGLISQFSGVLRDEVCILKNRYYDKGREILQ